MATTQEIKDAKRAQLDELLVEQGLDPAEYSNIAAAQEALYPFATDVDDSGDDEGAGDGAGDDEGNDDDTTTTPAVNDADVAADKAETPKVEKTDVLPSGHAAKFDKNGQPIFGKAK